MIDIARTVRKVRKAAVNVTNLVFGFFIFVSTVSGTYSNNLHNYS